MTLKELIKTIPPYIFKYHILDRRHGPKIAHEQGHLSLGDSEFTFVLICGPRFNQSLANAATTSRMGWCRGFEQIGVPYIIISVFDLAKRLPEIPNPICWISGSDYIYLNRRNLHALKKCRHIVWVSTHFKGDAKFYQEHQLPNMSSDKPVSRKILSTEPEYLFTISNESRFEYYEGWIRHGARLVSIPLACDTSLYYYQCSSSMEFKGVKLAFVGGYWEYKARQLDKYLTPYKKDLTVFGYSKWPYGQYGGYLAENKEHLLYEQAFVSPVINEPHASLMSIDINERVFKVLGSRGLAVTDVTSGYKELFNDDELLIPDNNATFHELIHNILSDPARYEKYRERGHRAILSRHTYAHRAEKLCSLLGLNHPLKTSI